MCFYTHHVTHLTNGKFQNKRKFLLLIIVQGKPPHGKQIGNLKMFKKKLILQYLSESFNSTSTENVSTTYQVLLCKAVHSIRNV